MTDTRRAMVGRRVADRLAALGTLAASVGHEINNPLAYSMATLEQLQQKLASPEPPTAESLRSHVEQALDGLARVAEITRDLMAIARDSATAEDFDLVEVLRSAARLAGNELRHAADLHLDLPETLPAVHGHASRITQVIVNLLVNATQAMAEIDRRDHEVRVHAAAEGAGVRITLSDTGPGIAPELIDRIREPFFTTKGVGGSGLGLAVCDSIIEEHGGELDIESELGVGTTVRLWLPISTRTPTPAPVRDSGPATGLRRVLVVDDEAPLARLLAKVLRPAEVVVHTTGADALGHIAHDARFDAVLLDVMMSDTTGLDVYEDLPDTLKPRVVFITGGVFQPKIRDALDRLPNPILSKPFSRSQLLDAVDQVAP